MAEIGSMQGPQVGRLLDLLPVGLKEAAIDSPTSRASITHFSEQIDIIEKWLDDYIKATNRLISESVTLEAVFNSFISHSLLPLNASEAIVDHDYSLLAMKKQSECSKDYWLGVSATIKKLTTLVIEPIRSFSLNELRAFKEVRRHLEQTQRNFDTAQAKYAGLSKTKEPSFLREEAFQLYETRRAYSKASLDFAFMAPQLRFSLDKLLVRVFTSQFQEMRNSRDNVSLTLQRSAGDLDRVGSWVRETEEGEKSFRRELQAARKQLEETADSNYRPSRELEDYTHSTIGHLGAKTTTGLTRSPKKTTSLGGERQGWLYLRIYTGRPTRVQWIKRWAFIRNGVFGFLILGAKPGSVEESERIGVLLCNARPAPLEERRFCFEIKTNKNSICLQAETQTELESWLQTFETAKSKALDDPAASDSLASLRRPHSDPAFSISPPPVPEFGTSILASLDSSSTEEAHIGDRSGTLSQSTIDLSRESTDLARRSTGPIGDEGGREHSSKLISKLETLRKSSANPPMTPTSAGGIASLIAATHGSMPVGPNLPIHSEPDLLKPRPMFRLAPRDMPSSSLAPSTLIDPPAPTNMSRYAVTITGERGISSTNDKVGMPNGLLANVWGSSEGYVNRLDRKDLPKPSEAIASPSPAISAIEPVSSGLSAVQTSTGTELQSMSSLDLTSPPSMLRSRTPSPEKRHRSTISLDIDVARASKELSNPIEYPNYYPLQLKTQDAQFRLLFPSVRRDERLTLVFRASWDPNDEQQFSGRAYVTMQHIYFYSSHLGLILTTGVALSSIDEVTAAPGREADYLFLHLTESRESPAPTRITIKTFVEPLKLLQRRLNALAKNSVSEEPLDLENMIKTLLKMESERPDQSPSLESWEEVAPDTPVDGKAQKNRNRASTIASELKVPTRVDRSLGAGGQLLNSGTAEKGFRFKLPAQPVSYTPPGKLRLAVDSQYDISPKALFHILFGDKSTIWQLLLHSRHARELTQSPWTDLGEGRFRREFRFQIPATDRSGHKKAIHVLDYQVIDVNSDHLCYVVTDKRTAWHLPFSTHFRLASKVVITHMAKGRCKLAIFTKVEWLKHSLPTYMRRVVENQALNDLDLDALDLADVVDDQVRRLGAHSRTKKAVQIFGQVGQSTEPAQIQLERLSHPLELRHNPTKMGVFALLWAEIQVVLRRVVMALMRSVFVVIKSILKVFRANYIIIAILIGSALLNGFYGWRDTFEWWHERQAEKFMSRLGVSPNVVMSRAVYVHDLHQVLTDFPTTNASDPSACYTVFKDTYEASHNDEVSHSPRAGDPSIRASQTVRHAQQRLGTYRHDLLVALKIVNNIETELLQGAWEQWIDSESRNCRRTAEFIADAARNETGGVGKANADQVQRWYDDYCESCFSERVTLLNNV